MTSSETLAFMELAIQQAKLALNVLEVPVGCVIVEDGKVIASGRNRTTETRNATRHAEMEAIDVLLGQWQKHGLSMSEVAEKFSNCSLYVTCEPCIMCASALSILDLLYKDYNFDHKFSLSIPNSAGLGLIATGLKKDQIFVGDISTLYKSGNTTVDVKVDTYSNISTKVTVNDILHGTKAALSFNIPDHKSGKMSGLCFPIQRVHAH